MEVIKNLQYKKHSWLKTIVLTLMVLFIIDHFFLGVAVVEGESMYPTINPADRLIYLKKPALYRYSNRGDIVIFRPPENISKEGLFIKRVVAIEGDSYCIVDGILTINGIEIEEEYVCKEIYIDKNYPYIEGVVPKDKVFVMGDNRNNSNDSRRFYCVELERIKGKAIMKIWPLNEIQRFLNPYN